MEGWIKLHRCLLDKPIWVESSPAQKVVIISLLLMTNHKDNTFRANGEIIHCKKGQIYTSLGSIAQSCGKGISVQNVRTALSKLCASNFLKIEAYKSGTIITILKWQTYQNDSTNTPQSLVTNTPQSLVTNTPLTCVSNTPQSFVTNTPNEKKSTHLNNAVIISKSNTYNDNNNEANTPQSLVTNTPLTCVSNTPQSFVTNTPNEKKSTTNKNNNINTNNKEKNTPKGVSKKKEEASASLPSHNSRFEMLSRWMEKEAKNVLKMQEPFTEAQIESIYAKYPRDAIKNTILAMHNWRDLNKKNISAYLTFSRWIEKDINAPSEKKSKLQQNLELLNDDTRIFKENTNISIPGKWSDCCEGRFSDNDNDVIQ